MLFIILTTTFAVISVLFYRKIKSRFNFETEGNSVSLQLINAMAIGTIIMLTTLPEYSIITILIDLVLWPLCILWMIISFIENKIFVSSLGRTFSILSQNWSKLLGTNFSIFSLQWLSLLLFNGKFLMIFSTLLFAAPVDLVNVFTEFIGMNIPRDFPYADQLPMIIFNTMLTTALILLYCLSVSTAVIQYFSMREVSEAVHLKTNISTIGFKKRAYGLEQEA